MAILLNGINGPFSGKVGTVVGYTWKGKQVMRGLPRKRTGKLSTLQLQQHAKFSLLNKFLKPLIPLLNETFKTVAVQMTGFNKAFSYNVKNTVTGTYPELSIDHNLVLLGRGDLPNAKSPAAESGPAGQVKFSWADNSGTGLARPDDKAFIAVYCEELNDWKYGLDLAVRSVGEYLFETGNFSGRMVHTYIGFVSYDGKDVSDSQYTGRLQIV